MWYSNWGLVLQRLRRLTVVRSMIHSRCFAPIVTITSHRIASPTFFITRYIYSYKLYHNLCPDAPAGPTGRHMCNKPRPSFVIVM